MAFRLAGFEVHAKDRLQSNVQAISRNAERSTQMTAPSVPSASPVLADKIGNCFAQFHTEDGIFAVPFIPGSAIDPAGAAVGERGGFIAAEKFPQSPARGSDSGIGDFIGGMAQQLPSSLVNNWLGSAAVGSMLGAAPGGMMDSTLKSLGMNNPFATGALGAAMGTALSSLGPAGKIASGLLPAAASLFADGGPGGLAQSLGNAGIGVLLNSTGLGSVPGAGVLGGLLGSQVSSGLSGVLGGGVADAGSLLDQAGGCFGGCFPGSDAMPGLTADPTNGGCFGTGGGPDLGAIGADALNSAADHLLSQWKVDDESSAAEHIAHKAVNDNKDSLKAAATDPDAFMEKMKKFFGGEAPGAGMPAVRISDTDDGADISNMGVGTILFEKLPVSRITDTVVGPKSPAPKPILEGAATVLSAGLPTAFLSAKTAVPSMMAKGAATIFVGGAVASISPPETASAPNIASNSGPSAPAGPDSKKSSTSQTNETGNSAENSGSGGDSTAGDNSQSESPSATRSDAEESPSISSANESAESPTNTSSTASAEEGPEKEGIVTLPIREGGPLGGENAVIKADPAAEANYNRNQYQEGLCPETRPYSGYVDKETGITFGSPEYFNYYHMKEGELCVRGSGGVLDENYTKYDQHTNDFIRSRGYDPSTLTPSVQCCYDLTSGRPGVTSSYDFSSPQGLGDGLGSGAGVVSTGVATAIGGPHVQLDVVPSMVYGSDYPQAATSGRPTPPPPPPAASTGLPTYMNPADAPPGTLKQLGQSNSPPVGGFVVDPRTGQITYG